MTESLMRKFKTTLILSAATLCLSAAAPSYAQYGSGTPGGSSRPSISNTQSNVERAQRRAEKKARKALKKQQAALAEKEAMEKELLMKEKEAAAYGSGTPAAEPAYGSGTPAAEPAYGSATPAAKPAYGSGTPAAEPAYGSGNAAPVGLPTNCPSGTQPQTDGTCMLTSGSFPTG